MKRLIAIVLAAGLGCDLSWAQAFAPLFTSGSFVPSQDPFGLEALSPLSVTPDYNPKALEEPLHFRILQAGAWQCRIALQSISSNRRQFIRLLGFAAAGHVLSAQVETADSQVPSWLRPGGERERDDPRRFSHIGSPPPAHVQTVIDFSKDQIIAAQDRLYLVTLNGLSIKANGLNGYWRLLDKVYFDTGYAIAAKVVDDLKAHGGLPAKRIADWEKRLSLRGTSVEDFWFIYDDLLPQYFELYGLYFSRGTALIQNMPIPFLDLSPVLRKDMEARTLEVFPAVSITAEVYTLGSGYFPLLDAQTSHIHSVVPYQVNRGTNQLFQRPYLNRAESGPQIEFCEQLVGQKPSVVNGSLFSPQDEPNAAKRGYVNLFLVSLRRAALARHQTPSLETYRALIPELLIEAHKRHEFVHIYEGTHAYLRNTVEFRDLIEQHGELGGAIGWEHADFQTALMLQSQSLVLAMMGSNESHVTGGQITIKELTLHLAERQRPAIPGAKEFSDLTPQAQAAVWDSMAGLPPADWTPLYLKIWVAHPLPSAPLWWRMRIPAALTGAAIFAAVVRFILRRRGGGDGPPSAGAKPLRPGPQGKQAKRSPKAKGKKGNRNLFQDA